MAAAKTKGLITIQMGMGNIFSDSQIRDNALSMSPPLRLTNGQLYSEITLGARVIPTSKNVDHVFSVKGVKYTTCKILSR